LNLTTLKLCSLVEIENEYDTKFYKRSGKCEKIQKKVLTSMRSGGTNCFRTEQNRTEQNANPAHFLRSKTEYNLFGPRRLLFKSRKRSGW